MKPYIRIFSELTNFLFRIEIEINFHSYFSVSRLIYEIIHHVVHRVVSVCFTGVGHPRGKCRFELLQGKSDVIKNERVNIFERAHFQGVRNCEQTEEHSLLCKKF